MELLELCLILMGALIISAAAEPFLPRVSLPLVQMLIGVALYFLVEMPADFEIDSDLLLVLFISPLLFDESKNASTRALWKNKWTILSMAIFLVVVMAAAIAFSLHWLVPAVPLAAAFALGGALGPTDAVAVASLSKEVKLNTRQRALLTGEALLNDASGIVTFQFAVAAAVTGTFSAVDAGTTFALEFFGGIAVGLVIAIAAFFLVNFLRKGGVESAVFHVCYEIFLPFFSYIIASTLEMSGILAVVACGLAFTLLPNFTSVQQRMSPSSARIEIASSNVWHFLSFILNGVIFLYLGFTLPSTLEPALEETALSTPWLFAVGVFITLVSLAVRFVWILVMDVVTTSPETDVRTVPMATMAKNALVTTLAGPRGAVSLSIALTMPAALSAGGTMPVRDFLLFLTCIVIICTLCLANFVVPLLSPADDTDDDSAEASRVEAEIVTNVISALRAQRTPENRRATAAVTAELSSRRATLEKDAASTRHLRHLRQEILLKQEDYIHFKLDRDEVDPELAERYLKRIERMSRKLHGRRGHASEAAVEMPPLASTTTGMRRLQAQVTDTVDERRQRLDFKVGVERVAVEHLEQVAAASDAERARAAGALLSEHKPLLATLESRLEALSGGETDEALVTVGNDGTPHIDRDKLAADAKIVDDVRAEAFRLELDEIQSMNEAGRLSNAAAREKRQEIYLQQMALAND